MYFIYYIMILSSHFTKYNFIFFNKLFPNANLDSRKKKENLFAHLNRSQLVTIIQLIVTEVDRIVVTHTAPAELHVLALRDLPLRGLS